VLLGSLLPGTKVALVVEVYSVSDGIEAAPAAKFFHGREQLILAMKAAGSVIAGVFRTIEFAGHNNLKRDALLPGEGGRVRQLSASQAGRVGDDGQHVAA
jgi:hypothetical protein